MRPKMFCSLCERPAHAYGLCDTHYHQQKRFGAMFSPPTADERFWSKVQKTDGCWLWTATRKPGWYGKFRFNGKQENAHRVAYILTYGTIPDGLWVLHRCDNPLCVRPDHLYLGTHQDNVRDRQERGRAACGDNNGSRMHPERILSGEQCSWAKLTAAEVAAIRQEYALGNTTYHKLAAKYGVGKSQIGNILQGKVWKDAN